MEVDASELQAAIEKLHSCRASLKRVHAVTERFEGKTVWEGVVHEFEVEGVPGGDLCYAWSSPIPGATKRRFYAVLCAPPIDSPTDAVRASIVRDSETRSF